jgi:hypothetical protein
MGRLLFTFRSWIPDALIERFGKANEEALSGKDTVGFYSRTFKLAKQEGILNMLKMWAQFSTFQSHKFDNNGHMSALDKASLRRSMFDANRLIFTYVALMVLNGFRDGDDEEEGLNYVHNYMANTLLRYKSDASFFVNPIGTEDFLKNILPLASILTDIKRFGESFYDSIFLDPRFKSGPHKGEFRLLHRLAKFVPLGYQTQQVLTTLRQQYKQR